jgi:hypothetical protein
MVATRMDSSRVSGARPVGAERRHSKGTEMSRNFMIAMGAMLWAAFAVDAIVHVAVGYWIAPVVAGMMGVAYVAIRRTVRRAKPVTA